MSRADLGKDPREVAAMFDGVARHYDRTNSILSFGLDRFWRGRTRHALGARAGERILDLAAGTAVSTVELADSGAWCVAVDFSLGMLRGGARRGVPRVAADALRLPFADASFDAVTVSFGLRNFTDTVAALEEMRRVVRPGGRMVVCEFSTPRNGLFRTVYFSYLPRALPLIAKWVSSNSDAYGYLAESIEDWPDQRRLAGLMEQAGWRDPGYRDLTGGIVAVHHAVNPGPTGPPPARGVAARRPPVDSAQHGTSEEWD
jgi:demethylmenaquinone methyltransferase / 2-methoxy-6-polyprenyl-1,4-benzoquinol methylase